LRKFYNSIFFFTLLITTTTSHSFDQQINKVMEYFLENKNLSLEDSLEGKEYNSHIALEYYTATRCFGLYKNLVLKAHFANGKEIAQKYMNISAAPHNVISQIIANKKGIENPKKRDDPNFKKVVSEILVDTGKWERHYRKLIAFHNGQFSFSGTTANDKSFCENIKFN
jgi:hypothetical protein